MIVPIYSAGLTGDVLDSAISSFIQEVVAKHAEPANRYRYHIIWGDKDGYKIARISHYCFVVQ